MGENTCTQIDLIKGYYKCGYKVHIKLNNDKKNSNNHIKWVEFSKHFPKENFPLMVSRQMKIFSLLLSGQIRTMSSHTNKKGLN